MPAAIPGLVLGLGYILAFNKPYYIFYGTPWIIVICVVIANFTLGTLSSISNIKNIDPSIEEAATSLGSTSISHLCPPCLSSCKGGLFPEFCLLLYAFNDDD